MSRLETVRAVNVALEEPPGDAVQVKAPSAAMSDAATKMMLHALSALWERYVLALAQLFTLLTAASAFYLWMNGLKDPTPEKLIGLTIYSVFIVFINWGKRP